MQKHTAKSEELPVNTLEYWIFGIYFYCSRYNSVLKCRCQFEIEFEKSVRPRHTSHNVDDRWQKLTELTKECEHINSIKHFAQTKNATTEFFRLVRHNIVIDLAGLAFHSTCLSSRIESDAIKHAPNITWNHMEKNTMSDHWNSWNDSGKVANKSSTFHIIYINWSFFSLSSLGKEQNQTQWAVFVSFS